jgi:prepilin-type N-terminal cleavage/methylation domain-containing protein
MSRLSNTRRGFTIAELLLVLAITGMLLAAVATAFNALSISHAENERMFKAVSKARQAMLRITTQLRTAESVGTDSQTDQCTLTSSSGENLTYLYDSDAATLYLVTNDDGSDPDYVLCDNVSAARFDKATFSSDGETKVKYVQISLTITDGDTQQTVNAAAAVRRNLN